MTSRPARQARATVRKPAPYGLALHPGTPRTGWCTTCRAWTHISVDLLLFAPDGLSTVGTWAWCEVCEDPDSPLPVRRIDRG